MVAVMLRLWPEAEEDVLTGVVTDGPSGWGKSTGGGTGTPARLKRRLCPSGRSLRLGARGRCRPRARPPICGSSKVADRQMYKMMS